MFSEMFVGVLYSTFLPGSIRITEVYWCAEKLSEFFVSLEENIVVQGDTGAFPDTSF